MITSINPCECGCGEFPKQGNRYIKGHNWKGLKRGIQSIKHKQNLSNSLKGKKRTEKFKQNISEKFSGENHPFYGKHHTEETKQKIRRTEKNLKRIPWNKGKTGVYSEDTLNKMSESISKIYVENGGINTGYRGTKKGKFFSKKNNKDIFYGSSYELRAFNILEQIAEVENYDRCSFYIPYNFKGSNKKYIPDIEVNYKDGTKEIIEVKPKALISIGKNSFKFEALKNYCLDKGFCFSIWDETFLFKNE